MEFRTVLSNDTAEFTSEPGSMFLQEYEYKLDKKGAKQLVKKDSQIDVYSKIQADAQSCDINYLMQRFALGDTEALDINKGFYLDTRDMPKTYAEVFERGLECEQYFDGLPVDLKEMFDNSYSVFFTEMNETPDKFDKKVAQYNSRFVDTRFDVNDDGTPKEIDHNE